MDKENNIAIMYYDAYTMKPDEAADISKKLKNEYFHDREIILLPKQLDLLQNADTRTLKELKSKIDNFINAREPKPLSKDQKTLAERIGVDEPTFERILFNGFYYYDEKHNDIYWQPNGVFVGNGYCPHSCSMIATHPTSMNSHEFNWDYDKSFCFEDYGKTWSIFESDLTYLIKKKGN